MTTLTQTSINKYWQYALWLALFTVFYNLAEGLVSIYFGAHDETLTLFGFGLDSFIEVVSGIGILFMVLRIRQNANAPRSLFEQSALRITGISFYLFAVGLGITAIYNLFAGHKPTTTFPSLIISLVSITVMWMLVMSKRKVGRGLNSSPILADANCSMVCIYMSIILLASSLIYQFTGFGFVDTPRSTGLDLFFNQRRKRSF